MSTASLFQKVNDWCRKVFIYKKDKTRRGVVEHWPDRKEIAAFLAFYKLFKWKWVDDCDGFAALARFILKGLGFKPRFVFCRVKGYPPGEDGHLVTECHGKIFDNRNRWVKHYKDIDEYEWVSISGYEKGDKWKRIIG